MISLDQLSSVGIGTSRIASLGSRMSLNVFMSFLEKATLKGVNLIDTADFYGSGDSERLIGQSLRLTGYPFFVITKAGLPYVHTPGWMSPLNQVAKKVKQRMAGRSNYSASYLIGSLQKSNRRLGVDTVDAFLLHEPTWSNIANTDSWEGLDRIRQQGLARYTGVSTNDYLVVETGIRSGQIQLVQTAVGWQNDNADSIIGLCRANGIPVIANQALRDYSVQQPVFTTKSEAIQQLDGLAGISLVQFLIAAVLAENRADAVLFGTSNINHLAHNIESVRYVSSLASAMPQINHLLS